MSAKKAALVWKLLALVGALAAIVGVALLAINLANVDAAGHSAADGNRALWGFFVLLLGLLLFAVGRIGAWITGGPNE